MVSRVRPRRDAAELGAAYEFDIVLRGPGATPFEEDAVIFATTPSQTVGPYFAIGLPWADGPHVVAAGTSGAIRIAGRSYDGAGDRFPTTDRDVAGRSARRRSPTCTGTAARRSSSGFRGFARCGQEGGDGTCEIVATVKPGPVPGLHDATQAPHIDVSRVRARAAAATGHPHLLRRRARAQRERSDPVARPRATGLPRCWPNRPTMATDSTSGSKASARPSSSRSEPALLDGIFARGEAAAAAADDAFLQALLDTEAALARACARARLLPEGAAEGIAACCRAERFDREELAAQTARNAQPVVGLVVALRRAVGEELAEHVHYGATSQDIVDTALMLVAQRAVGPLLDDLTAAADGCARIAEQYAATPIIGRTLLQQAMPTTFGLKAAGWMTALDDAAAGLVRVRDSVLAVQLGGPVGALHAPALVDAFAQQLGLGVPTLPWHTDRRRPAELAAALGVAAGATAKLATDVALLSQSEVAEVREGGPGGGSSSMAHKRNPVAAVSILACAQRVPALVAAMLGAMLQEHERAAGRWQAEWPTLLELLRLAGSAGAWAADLAGGLDVDADRMAANLAASPVPEGDAAAASALVARALDARRSR